MITPFASVDDFEHEDPLISVDDACLWSGHVELSSPLSPSFDLFDNVLEPTLEPLAETENCKRISEA